MKVIRLVIVVLLSVLAVFFLTSSVLIITSSHLLYPEFYTSSLSESGFYDSLQQEINSIPGSAILVLPDDGVKPIIEEVLDNILSYIRGDSEEISLTVTINPDIYRKALLNNVKELPRCIDELVPFEGYNFLCLPEEMAYDSLLDDYLEKNGLIIEEQTIDLAQTRALSEGSPLRESLDRFRDVVELFRILLFIYLAGFLVITFFIFLIMPAQRRKILLVVGLIIFFSALIIILTGFSLKTLEKNYINIEEPVAKSIIDIATTRILSKFIYYGLVLLCVGAGLTFFGVIIPSKKEKAHG